MTCSYINLSLIKKSGKKTFLECKFVKGEILTIQHKVLVMDVRIKGIEKRRSHMGAPHIKWWYLKGGKKGICNTRSWNEVLENQKKVQMICGITWPNRLEKWLKRRWVNHDILDIGVKNLGGGMKVFIVILE